MSYWIGLTGGVASGKSTVSKFFENLGIQIIDADEIAKELCEPGQAGLHVLHTLLPKTIPYTSDQRLDRRALRTLIFDDKEIKAKVEAALHPLIKAALFERASASNSPYVLIAVPLLIETGWYKNVNRILVVDVPEATQIERLIKRDNINEAAAQKMIANQATREQRKAFATDIIDNTQSIDTIAETVKNLHKQFLELAHAHDNKPHAL